MPLQITFEGNAELAKVFAFGEGLKVYANGKVVGTVTGCEHLGDRVRCRCTINDVSLIEVITDPVSVGMSTKVTKFCEWKGTTGGWDTGCFHFTDTIQGIRPVCQFCKRPVKEV